MKEQVKLNPLRTRESESAGVGWRVHKGTDVIMKSRESVMKSARPCCAMFRCGWGEEKVGDGDRGFRSASPFQLLNKAAKRIPSE